MLTPFNPTTNAPYTAAEQARLRAEFAPVAATYRRQKRFVGWCVGILAAGMLLSAVGPASVSTIVGPLVGFGFVACVVVGVVMAVRMAGQLRCPGCAGDLEQIGTYCPECGSAGLEPGSWFSAPHCPTCDRKMRRNKGRHYTIRACSHCGLYLDDEGV
ncbi:hypothetical protein [Hymenobacter ruricola]|uniref:DZANK-type domain-containing protein n=1 Tax=Hymenobacter ruricola TaxID=2791023 RepID=A0ABS0IAR5_9BACT|nr:hypothetical protein [Hymenobacter ruricola]MBF9224040.1 hypothetical protein [Hymenobacter ruricola]